MIFSKKLNKFHIGSTENLKNRFKEHNLGETTFISRGIPWTLVYYEAFMEKEDANREEKFLKTGQGRERRKYLLKCYLENNK
ncbi:MAG: GIY-YIG nuclease family protein [Patescibacteria group bacterium]